MVCSIVALHVPSRQNLADYGAEPFLRNRLSLSYWRTSQYFMETDDTLPPSQSPSRVRTLSPINPVTKTKSYLSKIHFSIIHHLRLGLPRGLLPSGFPTDIYTNSSSPTCVPHDLPISLSLTWSFWLYLAKGTSYKVMQFSPASCHLSLFDPNANSGSNLTTYMTSFF
jgi:hypothetical protein